MRKPANFIDGNLWPIGAAIGAIGLLAGGVYYAVSTRKSGARKDRDLQKINGIGPGLKDMLNREGVHTIAQIARWNQSDIDRMNAKLNFAGRIERDDWVGQAQALSR